MSVENARIAAIRAECFAEAATRADRFNAASAVSGVRLAILDHDPLARAIPGKPCFRCGARSDIACGHQRPEAFHG